MKIKTEAERKAELFNCIASAGCVAMLIYALMFSQGCMQITGAKKITMGTWSIEANNGFEAKAGVQQYDYVSDERGIGVKNKSQ